MRFDITQYSCKPAANGAMMNIRNQGMIANTCFWTSSIGCGLSFCISHIVTPSRIGRTPMARNAGRTMPVPNRLNSN